MNDIEEKLKAELPEEFLQYLIFLDEWTEPSNFPLMKLKDRILLMNKFIKKAADPTQKNYWVWFGSYSPPDYCPSYNRHRVPRILYEALRGPLEREDGTVIKLTNSFVESISDVNIFKFLPSSGSRLKTQIRWAKINNGTGLDKTSTQKLKKAAIDLTHYRDSFPTVEKMTFCLQNLGYDNFTIERVISEADPKLGD